MSPVEMGIVIDGIDRLVVVAAAWSVLVEEQFWWDQRSEIQICRHEKIHGVPAPLPVWE